MELEETYLLQANEEVFLHSPEYNQMEAELEDKVLVAVELQVVVEIVIQQREVLFLEEQVMFLQQIHHKVILEQEE